jgi:hypothetical protein
MNLQFLNFRQKQFKMGFRKRNLIPKAYLYSLLQTQTNLKYGFPTKIKTNSVSVETRVIANKYKEMTYFNSVNVFNNQRILILFACHSDSKLKLNTIRNNLAYLLQNKNVDIAVINSKNTAFSNEVQLLCALCRLNYYEIDNSSLFDFGKWLYLLENIDYSPYSFISFTNDSIFLESSLAHFFNLTIRNNYDLFGYNDSTQQRYHYQSYLFSLKNTAIPTFVQFIKNKREQIHCQDDVINHYEIQMTDQFCNHGVFLNIGKLNTNYGSNIFFTNDRLYLQLLKSKLLPFVKIKRAQALIQ